MATTLVSLLVHVIFSTKNRADIITPEIEPGLYEYMGGIARNHKSRLLAANGTANHSHLLISLGKTIALSELIAEIKRDSSKWAKDRSRGFRDFYWQEGYGAFSIGQSQTSEVKRYIAEQKEKHQARTFEREFIGFLKKYEVEYDERYIWD